MVQLANSVSYEELNGFLSLVYIDKQGGFKNQPQQLMFSSRFSQFHVEKELAINLYR